MRKLLLLIALVLLSFVITPGVSAMEYWETDIQVAQKEVMGQPGLMVTWNEYQESGNYHYEVYLTSLTTGIRVSEKYWIFGGGTELQLLSPLSPNENYLLQLEVWNDSNARVTYSQKQFSLPITRSEYDGEEVFVTKLNPNSTASQISISEDKIVYSDNRNGNEDIYLYDIPSKTERRLTADPEVQRNPRIHGNIVVWEDRRNTWTTGSDIYGYDLSTDSEIIVCNEPGSQSNPEIWDNRIVWLDGRKVCTKNINETGSTVISERFGTPLLETGISIYENTIVWTEADSYDLVSASVYAMDVTTGNKIFVGEGLDPSIYGTKVVYSKVHFAADSGNPEPTVWVTDLYTKVSLEVSKSSVPGFAFPIDPEIYGDKVVWSGYETVLYDSSKNVRINISNSNWSESPAIWGNDVAWIDGRDGSRSIYLWDGIDQFDPVVAIGQFRANNSIRNGEPGVTLYWGEVPQVICYRVSVTDVRTGLPVYIGKLEENSLEMRVADYPALTVGGNYKLDVEAVAPDGMISYQGSYYFIYCPPGFPDFDSPVQIYTNRDLVQVIAGGTESAHHNHYQVINRETGAVIYSKEYEFPVTLPVWDLIPWKDYDVVVSSHDENHNTIGVSKATFTYTPFDDYSVPTEWNSNHEPWANSCFEENTNTIYSEIRAGFDRHPQEIAGGDWRYFSGYQVDIMDNATGALLDSCIFDKVGTGFQARNWSQSTSISLEGPSDIFIPVLTVAYKQPVGNMNYRIVLKALKYNIYGQEIEMGQIQTVVKFPSLETVWPDPKVIEVSPGTVEVSYPDYRDINFKEYNIKVSDSSGNILLEKNTPNNRETFNMLPGGTVTFTVSPVDFTTNPLVSKSTTVTMAIDTAAPGVDVSMPGATYEGVQTVELTSDDSQATIYYTVDGSDPLSSGIKYTMPLSIATDTVLKYYAVDTSGNQSDIYSQQYSITYTSNLVSTEQNLEQGEEATLSVVVPEGQDKVTFSAGIEGSDLKLTLQAPDGTLIDSGNFEQFPKPGFDSSIEHVKTPITETFIVHNPMIGDWKLTLIPYDFAPGGEQVTLAANVTGALLPVDSDAPVSSTQVEGTLYDSEWYKGSAVLKIDAFDTGGSGLEQIMVKVDEGDWQKYTGAIKLEAGEHFVEYYSVDNNGNKESVKTISVKVFEYNFSGILKPVNTDGSSVFKLGSTVPVKFQLTDYTNASVTNAVAKVYVTKIDNDVLGTELEADSTSNATIGNLARYDAQNEQYIFNLGTDGLSVGTWQLRIVLDDGTSKYVNLSLK